MDDSVTDVVASRARRVEPWRQTLLTSVGAHVVLLGLVLALPSLRRSQPPPHVMMVSLGGAPGPRTGGMTQIGGQAVQEVTPPKPPPPRREPPRPAAAPPKMTLPDTRAKPAPAKQRREEADSARPVTGERVQEGNAPSPTQARGVGFGLSSAGGTGGQLTLDVSDFCCQDYLGKMVEGIKFNWHAIPPPGVVTVIRFTIRRDGSTDAVVVERSSGSADLDVAARRAVLLTTLDRLPDKFPNQTLTVRMRFEH